MLWKNIEDNASPAIRIMRIALLVLIVVGIGLIVKRDSWVPLLVDTIIQSERGSLPLANSQPPVDAKKVPPQNNPSVVCTMDAKRCSDGSYVGRTGPRCEFASCPTVDKSGTPTAINGFVKLSPICPVGRVPPDPACAPRGFETEVKILGAQSKSLIKTIRTKSDGSFSTTLPNGKYIINAVGGNPYPRCGDAVLAFETPHAASIELSCDTGIR